MASRSIVAYCHLGGELRRRGVSGCSAPPAITYAARTERRRKRKDSEKGRRELAEGGKGGIYEAWSEEGEVEAAEE